MKHRYQPRHDEIAFLAFQLWQNYGAAGFAPDCVTIWLEAEAILRDKDRHGES